MKSELLGRFDPWKSMLLLLVVYIAVPGYWQLGSPDGSDWGIWWFPFGWSASSGLWTRLQLLFENAPIISAVVQFIYLILPVLLIVFVVWAWRSKAPKLTAIALVLSALLTLQMMYDTYVSYSSLWGLNGYSYLEIPFDIVFLALLTVYAYLCLGTLTKKGVSGSQIRKPTAALVLSLIGGIILAGLGLVLLFQESTASLGWYEFVIGILVIACGAMAYVKPILTNAWGAAIVVLSVVAGGNLITLIGGVIALGWKAESLSS